MCSFRTFRLHLKHDSEAFPESFTVITENGPISADLSHMYSGTLEGGYHTGSIHQNYDRYSFVSSLLLSICFALKVNCALGFSAFWPWHFWTLFLFIPGERDSACYGSVFQGQFEGTIHTGNNTYHVESAHRYSDSKSHPHSIIYHEKDMGRNPFCYGLFRAKMCFWHIYSVWFCDSRSRNVLGSQSFFLTNWKY